MDKHDSKSMKLDPLQKLKQRITREARRLGANLVGYAPVSRWSGSQLDQSYWPTSVWPEAKTVIVLGVPMLLPIIESTPSINYQEMYNAANQVLDQAAFRLAAWLNGLGHAAIYLTRDGYGNLDILRRKPAASFSHAVAGKFAGLGTIGASHLLLTPEYGPRVRLVSVLASSALPGDPLVPEELCNGCRLCIRLCPVKAFSPAKGRLMAEMDKDPCTVRHLQLRRENRWPCGICAKVCCVGADRKLYHRTGTRTYLLEAEMANQTDPNYRAWEHMRAHGSENAGREIKGQPELFQTTDNILTSRNKHEDNQLPEIHPGGNGLGHGDSSCRR
jgi:epoxyqueuosine reductase QueG